MQNEWLKKQTNLVDMTNETEKINEEVTYLKTKQTSTLLIVSSGAEEAATAERLRAAREGDLGD